MQKLNLILSAILSVTTSALAQAPTELSPEAIEAIKKLACYVDEQTVSDGCGISNMSCFGGNDGWDITVFSAEEKYQACVVDICGAGNKSMSDYYESIKVESEFSLQGVQEKMNPHLDKLYSQLEKNVNEGREYLKNHPELQQAFDNERTLLNLLEGFNFTKANSDEQASLASIGHNLGWPEPVVRDIDRFVRSLQAAASSIDNESIFRSLANSFEKRRLMLGDLEQRIRALPDNSLNKAIFRQRIMGLQSASSIDQEGSITLVEQMMTLHTEVVVENFHLTNPEMVAMKNRILANVPAGNEQLFRIYEGLNGEKPAFKESCNRTISSISELLPTKATLEQIRARTETTRNRILQNVRGRFSDSTLRTMLPALSETRIVLPVDRESFLARIDSYVQEQAMMMGSFSGAEKAAYSAHSTNVSGMELGINLCGHAVETIPNAYAWSAGKGHNHDHHDHQNSVSLGAPFAINYDLFGERALAHEFGHIVSFHVRDFGSGHSKNGVQDAKNCLKGNHSDGFINGFMNLFNGKNEAIKIKQEEDYADLFSYAMIPSASPKTCGLFDNGVAIFDKSNFLDPSKKELHSPDFFRLLHENTYMGNPLPESCVTELKSNDELPDIKRCWRDPRGNRLFQK